jgi:hypothetical protein
MEFGAGWTGLGSVAMMLPCGTSIGLERRLTVLWRAGHKVRNRPQGWSAPPGLSRKAISVKRARERVHLVARR